MIINRHRLFAVFTGGLVAASLGFGLSAKTNKAELRQPNRSVTVPISAAQNPGNSFSDYDLAAGNDFLVSATPTHLARGRTVSAAQPEKVGGVVQIDDPYSASDAPAEDAGDGTAFVTGGSSLVDSPADLTLAPGTYSLAVNSGAAFEDDDRVGLFNFAGTGDGVNAFEASPGTASGFDLTQTMTPSADLAQRLYATSVVP